MFETAVGVIIGVVASAVILVGIGAMLAGYWSARRIKQNIDDTVKH